MAPPAYFHLGLLICLVIGPYLSSAVECPEEWLSYKNRCYGYFPHELTWWQAQAHCQHFKANLASILDADEHNAVADFLQEVQRDDEDVWIGFREPTRTQGWVWADNSPVTYTAWDRFKPSPFLKNEHCAQLDEDTNHRRWDDDSCYDQNPFLCKL